jgi:hypothetical protein
LLDGWFLKGAAAVVAVAGSSGCNLLLMAEEEGGGGGGGSAEEGKLGIVTDLNEGGQVFFLVGGGKGEGVIPETLGHKGLAFFQNKEYPESEMDQI